MTRNYLLVALRGLRRQPGYTALNVLGLAVGLACFFLLGLYVRDELTFDRFHNDVEQIYAVGTMWEIDGDTHYTTLVPVPTAPALAEHLPEVAASTRSGPVPISVHVGAERYDDQTRHYVDPRFFDVFDFPHVAGDLATALDAPDQAVLSARAAQRYFGLANPIGQTLTIQVEGSVFHNQPPVAREVTIRAVVAVPRTSSFTFDLLVSSATNAARFDSPTAWNTVSSDGETFVRLAPGVTKAQFQRTLDRFATDVVYERTQQETILRAVPLADYYFSEYYSIEGLRGDARYLTLFGGIALLVLLIALVNYVNLATAQAAERTREVGVRKAIGAGRGQLMSQFLCESVLLCLVAFVLALVLVTVSFPGFNALFGTTFNSSLLLEGATLPVLLLCALGAGLLAGIYPALVLAWQRPMHVLRSRATPHSGTARLRKGLVVGQFAVTVTLLIGVAGIVQQLRFIQTADLGFDGDQVLHVQLDVLAAQASAVKATFEQHPDVRVASATNAPPGQVWMRSQAVDFEHQPTAIDDHPPVTTWVVMADPDFAEVLDLTLVAGRFLDDAVVSDATRAVVINETAARAYGWGEGDAASAAALGKTLSFVSPESVIVGVVEDFHFGSMHAAIEPMGIRVDDPNPRVTWPMHTGLLLKLNTDEVLTTIGELEILWQSLAPDVAFEAAFVDAYYEQMYQSEVRLGRILGVFAGLAICVACLGLIGLAAFTAQRRTKEIGVRKVLGASVSSILRLLTRDFVVLVVVAFVIAAPLAWWGVQQWLGGFAYRAEVGAGTVLLAGLAALLLALLATGALAWRAARLNPVRALRYE
ncbi:MAG: ABC transporter permease [Bacteroidota bacterium]